MEKNFQKTKGINIGHRVWFLPVVLLFLLTSCDQSALNSPYSREESEQNVIYSSFLSRPKHLDPVRSYVSNEYAIIGQVYEPLLQYHFLKRPYQLIPLIAEQVPIPQYLDAAGNTLPENAPEQDIAISEYRIKVKQGVKYQPHPAFARNEDGAHIYHKLTPEQIAEANTLADFPKTGSREMTAADYIYQIKRLANPKLHSPIAGVIGQYIIGFNEFGKQVRSASAELQKKSGQDRPY